MTERTLYRVMIATLASSLTACGSESGAESAAETSPQNKVAQSVAHQPNAEIAVDQTINSAMPASYAQCRTCHSVEAGDNGPGPSLAGVFGREAGTLAGFNYSSAMRSSKIVWDTDKLDRFIADPRGTIPDSRMSSAPVRDEAKRKQIIAFLQSLE